MKTKDHFRCHPGLQVSPTSRTVEQGLPVRPRQLELDGSSCCDSKGDMKTKCILMKTYAKRNGNLGATGIGTYTGPGWQRRLDPGIGQTTKCCHCVVITLGCLAAVVITATSFRRTVLKCQLSGTFHENFILSNARASVSPCH